MFENYLATSDDLETIREAFKFIFLPKMRFVFSDLSKIIKVLIVSYDSKYIYVWSLNPTKLIKISHNLSIPDEWQMGWRASLPYREVWKYLPISTYNKQIISGGLLTPFITLQKIKKLANNPYTTKESYLATIVHEFGHINFGGSNKKGELAAFCTEYYASQLFWPKHIKLLDKFTEGINKKTPIKINSNDQHIFALLNANKFIVRYPKSWPKQLLK